MSHMLISLAALKSNLPVRAGNTTHDDRLRNMIRVATAQIEAATRRSFDKKVRVELYNTRDAGNRVINLGGVSDLSVDTFRNMGTTILVREQIIMLKSLPVDTSATIEVRYDPLRVFGTNTVVAADNYSVDAANGRMFLRFGTSRGVNTLQITYTGGFAVSSVIAIDPFSTWDPNNKGANVTLSNGNLTADVNAPNANVGTVMSLHELGTNKFYMEVTVDEEPGRIGLARNGIDLEQGLGQDTFGFAFDTGDGKTYTNGVGTAYGLAASIGSIVGMAIDLDLDAMWYCINGVWQNGATGAEVETGVTTNAAFVGALTGLMHVAVGDASAGATMQLTANFGATPFFTAPPSGFTLGWGAAFLTGRSVLTDPPDDLRLAAIVQSIFLWKKLDAENVGGQADKEQDAGGNELRRAAGLRPVAGWLGLTDKLRAKG